MANNVPPFFSIKKLFSTGQYVIPSYQRNYAWGEREITQLIQDVADYAKISTQSAYHIGSLVVFERRKDGDVVFETIDGQQRLTTLNLLLSVMKHEYNIPGLKNWFRMNLAFDSRQKSTDTLGALFNEGVDVAISENSDYNGEIIQAYYDIKKALGQMNPKTGFGIEAFYEYLTSNVHILRVSVPPDTELNHYFEIMNNRGEQLEKHEVLKAKFLAALRDHPRLSYGFNLIWEACANMERYVQYGFSVPQRNALFSAEDWDTFAAGNFDDLCDKLNLPENSIYSDGVSLTLNEILYGQYQLRQEKDKPEEETPEQFNTIVNFQNFLLHVLRVQTEEDIALDDKQLISQFEKYLYGSDPIAFSKDFGYNLLRCKFLFDKFLIKREFLNDRDHWSLKCMKYYARGNKASYVNTFGGEEDDSTATNRKVLMLLAMFHVSAPTQVYKHWLNAALRYVFEADEVTPGRYIKYLENLARAFLFNRYLTSDQRPFYDIIYKQDGLRPDCPTDEQLLNAGTNVENFVFNYLDYLLWKQNRLGSERFEYTFRSSVEHYYPQNPIVPDDRLEDEAILNDFGNLCLISASKNSRLSNNMPEAKRDYYERSSCDSIKQRLMMDTRPWNEMAIAEHGKEMKQLLLSQKSKDSSSILWQLIRMNKR